MSRALTLRRWTESEWLASREQCQALHGKSGADPLFLSFEWLTTWWRHFGRDLTELHLYAGYRGDELVGLAPFMLTRVRRGPFWLRSVQLIGGSLDHSDLFGAMSEYLDVISLPDCADEFRRAILVLLQESVQFSELGVSYTDQHAQWAAAITEAMPTVGRWLRPTDALTSYQADLDGGFQMYLRKLSASARRKIFLKRKHLASLGPLSIREVAAADLVQAFEQMNRLHALRWGKMAYAPRTLKFHLDLASVRDSAISSRLNLLQSNGRTVSVVYDIRAGNRQYNLQMGFDDHFCRQLSLGILHLGHVMELASDAGILTYDFLGGRGKTADYKPALAQRRCTLTPLWLLRGTVLANVFRIRDRFGQVK